MDPAKALQTARSWPTEARLQLALRLWDNLIEAGWQLEHPAFLSLP